MSLGREQPNAMASILNDNFIVWPQQEAVLILGEQVISLIHLLQFTIRTEENETKKLTGCINDAHSE